MDFLALTAAEKEALSLSLWISGWALAGSLPLGVLCAWVLARRNFPGKILMDGLIHLPMVLPPVVTGYVLLYHFAVFRLERLAIITRFWYITYVI